jgi:Rod binding domain-containing protein
MFELVSSPRLPSVELAPALGSSPSKHDRDTPDEIAKAATQFEALLIGRIIQSAREASDSGWMGTDEDDAGSTLMEASEQQISTALASQGGLGLAKMLTAGLTKTANQLASHSAEPAGTR